jgi:hypothetical protein
VEPGDPRRFLQHRAAFGGAGGDHRGDAALAHECGAVRAGGRVRKDQRHVLRPHVAPVDAVGAACAALDAADDFKLSAEGAGRVRLGREHRFGKVARGAARGAGEDHVFHAAAAHRTGPSLRP